MKKTNLYILFFLMLATLIGCKDEEDAVVNKEVTADLVFSVSASAEKQTRMTPYVVQNSVTGTAAYRGIQNICIVPMINDTPDTPENPIDGAVDASLDQTSASPSSWFYFYKHHPFTTGVNSFLIYGRAALKDNSSALVAKDPAALTVADKASMGSLVPTYQVDEDSPVTPVTALNPYPSTMTVSGIGFRLESIYPNASSVVPTAATKIATYLNYIAGAQVDETHTWRTSENSDLKSCYNAFIVKEEEESVGKHFAGASPNIKALVNNLYKNVSDLSFDTNTTEYNIKQDILNRIHSTDYVTLTDNKVTGLIGCDDYPASYGLPDGSTAMQWVNGTFEFKVLTQNTTEANINDITRYAFPPELYYRTNSPLKAMDNVDMQQVYQKTVWGTTADVANSSVLSYFKTGTDAVTATSKSVVVVNPLQYAVGHLQLNFRANAAVLKDYDDNKNGTQAHVPLKTGDVDNFPLTGIIVGSQRPVDFEFKPVDEETEVRFSYDRIVNTNTGNTSYYLKNLTGEGNYEGSVNSLVLQTPDDEKVYLLLEFQNNSPEAFKGFDGGIIYPGCKFYLLGVAQPTAKPSGDDDRDDVEKRVFTQDYTTVINMEVTTFKNAYNTIPNILSDRLEIGVLLTLQWEPATPTNVQLK